VSLFYYWCSIFLVGGDLHQWPRGRQMRPPPILPALKARLATRGFLREFVLLLLLTTATFLFGRVLHQWPQGTPNALASYLPALKARLATRASLRSLFYYYYDVLLLQRYSSPRVKS